MPSTTSEERPIASGRSRPIAVWLTLVGALGLGITALFGGGTLVLDPTGGAMGMPLNWLEGTPFPNYLVPGLILFSVLGLGSFVVLYGIVRRRAWARTGTIALGVALVGWIVTQILLIQLLHVLHAIYGGLGVALIGLALHPSMRTYFDRVVAATPNPSIDDSSRSLERDQQ
jgi:hypothetical protein